MCNSLCKDGSVVPIYTAVDNGPPGSSEHVSLRGVDSGNAVEGENLGLWFAVDHHADVRCDLDAFLLVQLGLEVRVGGTYPHEHFDAFSATRGKGDTS